MKLDAYLEVKNDAVACTGFKHASKPVYSQLTCSKDASNKYFLVANTTNKQNSTLKFKLLNNIEKVFFKFVDEGKATVKLKEPNSSLIIQRANAAQLKAFLKIIHLASKSTSFEKELNNLKLDQVQTSYTQLKKPQENLIVQKYNDFLTLKCAYSVAYSSTLRKIVFNECKLQSFNKHLLNCVNLEYLDLSSNELESIENLNYPLLVNLNLSKNKIRKIRNCNLPLIANVDLTHNRLTCIDTEFIRTFRSVIQLKLNHNSLALIHPNFGFHLSKLKTLYLADNPLRYVPHSLTRLRFSFLEFQNNDFDFSILNRNLNESVTFPRLVELASRKVLNARIKYAKNDLPCTLIAYLNKNSINCMCGSVGFEHFFKISILFDISRIAQEYSYVYQRGYNGVPMIAYLCSLKCFEKKL